MKLLIQKINNCTLLVENEIKAKVNAGLLIMVGVNKNDSMQTVKYLGKKVPTMRLFKDEFDKINKSILDTSGDILLVSNFTLNAEISSGTRPNFGNSADYETANSLYLALAQEFKNNGVKNVQTGCFRTHMHLDVALDGPFSIILEKE